MKLIAIIFQLIISINLLVKGQVSESDIKIYFYSQQGKFNPILVNISNPQEVASTPFSAAKPIYFFIHGFRENPFASECLPQSGTLPQTCPSQKIKNAVLNSFDVNCFLVDWSAIANPATQAEYPIVVSKVEATGKIVGTRIKNFVTSSGLSYNNIQLVGFSLGAHVGGVAGREVGGGLIKQVVGLDPAGPMFSKSSSNSLSPESGQFVQAIHTDGGSFGTTESLGDSDHWPNGGSNQPSCTGNIDPRCSHFRAIDYYTESLNSQNFVARSCDTIANYNAGQCQSNPQSSMGGFNVDTSASSNYFLNTNANSPYARSGQI